METRLHVKIDSIIKRLENYRSSNPLKQQGTSSKLIASSTTTSQMTLSSDEASLNPPNFDKNCDEEEDETKYDTTDKDDEKNEDSVNHYVNR